MLHKFTLNEDSLLFFLRTTEFETLLDVLPGRESVQMTSNRKTILNLVKTNALITRL